MSIIYNIAIQLFCLGIKLGSIFNEKAKKIAEGWKSIFYENEKRISHSKPLIWIHCSSLGEFEQGRPVIEAIKKNHPKYQIYLTFFSPSGYEIRKNYELVDYVSYLPADTKKNARRFVKLLNPEKVFFVKYEFWYNYITELKVQNIPLYLFSAIFREDQLFFKKSFLGKWYADILRNFQHLFVQDQHSLELLKDIDITNVTKAGDTRFDRVAEIAENGKKIPIIETFKNNKLLIVIGSSWPLDEEILIPYINKNRQIKFVIAPHEVKKSNIDRLDKLIGNESITYSAAMLETVVNSQVLIIDSIGLLSTIYRYADIAYIGGGFGVGIHNTLEAAIFSIPVIFGPNYQKFNEARVMIDHKVAFSVSSAEDLEHIFTMLISNLEERKRIAANIKSFTKENLGATNYILEKVFNNG